MHRSICKRFCPEDRPAAQAGFTSTAASAGVSGATSTASSSNPAPLFRTLFTARLTGQNRTTPGAESPFAAAMALPGLQHHGRPVELNLA